ncbi:MAG: leucyl aminopeptidase [Asticcacaulis sp.]
MNVKFVTDAASDAVLAVLVHESRALTAPAQSLDTKTGGALARAVASGRFTGAKGQSLSVLAPVGLSQPVVIALGAGKAAELDALAAEALGGSAYANAKMSGQATVALDVSHLSPDLAAQAAFGGRLAAYRFDHYRTTQKPDKLPSITTLEIVTSDVTAAEAAYSRLAAIAQGVEFCRDLVSEPANVLYPAEFARRVKAWESLGLEVEILGEADMEKLGMHSLLGVGLGSERESQLAVIRWLGAEDKSAAPVAFVGKGVCFDTGGISLKPGEGMEEMKWDMGGAGAVAGAMVALAGRKAKVNAVGILGLVENMPDGKAQRPGDVVKSMSGQTIEILNTDAEGRLVLADALWYCQQRFQPKVMIDLATLTGAMIIALGLDYAGVFANDDALAEALAAASKATGENSWRLPLPPQYEKLIDSPIADMKNIGGRGAGSITAALFLQRFVKDTPWAHIDIAPTAWTKEERTPSVPVGATGYGVRLLDQLVADRYEG